MAVIDVERLVRDTALGKAAFDRVKKVSDQKKAEIDRLEREVAELKTKIKNQADSLAEVRRDELQKQLDDKSTESENFRQKATRELADIQKKELAELERLVFPIITQIGQERGFTAIFNRWQSGVVFAGEGVDITAELVKRLDSQHPQPAVKSGLASPPAATTPPAKSPTASPAPRETESDQSDNSATPQEHSTRSTF